MRAPFIKLLALLLAGSLVFAACGGGDDDTDVGSDDTSQTTAADDGGDDEADDGEEAEITDEDREAVKGIVLTQEDVGTAYKQTKSPSDTTTTTAGGSTTSTTEDPNSAAFKECAGGKDLLDDDENEAKAESEFSNEATQSQLSSSATIATNEDEIKEVFDILSDDKTLACFDEAFKKLLAESMGEAGGATVANIKTTRSEVDLPTENETGFNIVLDVAAGGQTIKGYIDMAFFNEGRVVGSLFSFGFGQPFPETERTKLLGLMADRVVEAA